MFDRVLFPVDDTDGATATTDHVLDIADAHDATLHVLNVADTNQMSLSQIQGEVVDALVPAGERIVEETADRARRRGVDTVTEVAQGEPYSSIVGYAESRDIDLVVMPTHGRQGLDRFLLGSTTERVVRRSDVPVLTVQPNDDGIPDYPYQSVLVPTDGSSCADEALDVGVDLTNQGDSPLHVLSIVAISGFGDDAVIEDGFAAMEEEAEGIVDNAVSFAEDHGVAAVTGAVDYGPSIHREILSYVEEHDIGAVVAGTRGRTGVERYLLGSVTEYLVRTAPVPVLTVREPSPDQ